MTSPITRGTYPGEAGKAYPEKFDIRAIPPQPKTLKPGQQPQKEIEKFFTDGYILVKQFFTKAEPDACKRDIEKCVEDLAQVLYKAGKIKDLHEDAGMFERLTLIEKQYPDANVLLHRPRTQFTLYQGFKDIWANEKILNLLEQLIGPEIMAQPAWNIRPKIPNQEAMVIQWHQNNAYFDDSICDKLMPVAFIPLLDITKENGGLELLKGGHKTGKLARHIGCHKGTWYLELPEEEMIKTLVDSEKDKVFCEMKYGDLLLMNNLMPHRGLPNTSHDIRWTMDLRWMAPTDNCGWYGKKGILRRSKKHPVTHIDWDSFIHQNEVEKMKETKAGDDMLEPIYTSPYFKKWEMTNPNKHVRKFFEQEQKAKQLGH